MWRFALFFVIVNLITYGYSQSYFGFYENTIWSNIYANKGNKDSTILFLEKALAKIPDKSNYNFFVYLLELKMERKDSNIMQLINEIKPYLLCKEIEAEINESENSSKLFDLWNSAISKCKTAIGEGEVDTIYLKNINQLFFWDQYYRTDSMLALNKTMCDSIDAINFAELLYLFDTKGFIKLSGEAMANRVTLLYHIDDYNKFKKIDNVLKYAIKRGKLHPGNYAYAYDRSRIASNLTPKYYWFIPDTEMELNSKPPKSKIKGINKERKKIGLPSYPYWSGLWF